MPQKPIRTTYVDDDDDDETDAKIFNPLPTVRLFEPFPPHRLAKLRLMPPPTSNSITATRTLSKEFKATIKAQETGALPFYIAPDSDRWVARVARRWRADCRLYSWALELHEFPDSLLKQEMKQWAIRPVM